jgi:hypothetical protein
MRRDGRQTKQHKGFRDMADRHIRKLRESAGEARRESAYVETELSFQQHPEPPLKGDSVSRRVRRNFRVASVRRQQAILPGNSLPCPLKTGALGPGELPSTCKDTFGYV